MGVVSMPYNHSAWLYETEILGLFYPGDDVTVYYLHREGKAAKRLKESELVRESTQESSTTNFRNNSAAVPNLVMVEGIDNQKIANHIDRAVASIRTKPLKVLVQVNTSGEASKSGVEPSGCVELVKHVKLGCPNLEFAGLMTIGMPNYTSVPENFRTLSNCRIEVCKALGMAEDECELSMGMSGDFEQAIEMGSTNVRIGSTIFGPREYAKKL